MQSTWNQFHNIDLLAETNTSLLKVIEKIRHKTADLDLPESFASEGKFLGLAKSAFAAAESNFSLVALAKEQSNILGDSRSLLGDFNQQLLVNFQPKNEILEYAQRAASLVPAVTSGVMNRTVLAAIHQQQQLAENFAAEILAQQTAELDNAYFTRIVKELNSQYEDILADVFRPISDAPIGWRHWLPPNLEELGNEFHPKQIIKFVKEEPIPLYLVPRLGISESLLRAPDKASRRSILNQRADAIIKDCNAVIDSIDRSIFSDEVDQLNQAIDAYQSGLTRVAQAALATALDAITKKAVILSPGVTEAVIQQGNEHGERELEQIGIYGALVWTSIRGAFGRYNPHKGDKVPYEFSRHATVHSLEKRQYSKRNAIQALMLSTSLLGYIDELTDTSSF